MLASYSLNQHQAPNEITITVVCERGTARCEFHATPLALDDDARRCLARRGRSHPWSATPLFIAQAHRFLDAVEGQAAAACSLAEGLQTLRVNLAALASVGRPELAITSPRCHEDSSTWPTRRRNLGRSANRRSRSCSTSPARSVLITGGTGHLGSAMSRALAEAGASVVVTSRDAERAEAAAAALPAPWAAGTTASRSITCDPTSLERGVRARRVDAGRPGSTCWSTTATRPSRPTGRA